jgi:hypothetical protein
MRSRRTLAAVVAGVAALALLVVLAATQESRLVYTIGAAPAGPVAQPGPGEEACQAPIAPPAEPFDRVVVSLGTFGRPGEPVEVLIRSRSQEVLARGRLDGGYPDIAAQPEHAVPVPRTTLNEATEVCVRNVGARKVAVYGSVGLAHRGSVGRLEERTVGDIALRLERSEPRSLLAALPDVFDHAATFKAGWVGAWTFWLLAAVVLLAVPLLVARALAGALREDGL